MERDVNIKVTDRIEFLPSPRFHGLEGMQYSSLVSNDDKPDRLIQPEIKLNQSPSQQKLEQALMAFAGNGGTYHALWLLINGARQSNLGRYSTYLADSATRFGISVDSDDLKKIESATNHSLIEHGTRRQEVISFDVEFARTLINSQNYIAIRERGKTFKWNANDKEIPNGNLLLASQVYAEMVERALILGLDPVCVMGHSKAEQMEGVPDVPHNIRVMKKILEYEPGTSIGLEAFVVEGTKYDITSVRQTIDRIENFVGGDELTETEGGATYTPAYELARYGQMVKAYESQLRNGEAIMIQGKAGTLAWDIMSKLQDYNRGDIINFDDIYQQFQDNTPEQVKAAIKAIQVKNKEAFTFNGKVINLNAKILVTGTQRAKEVFDEQGELTTNAKYLSRLLGDYKQGSAISANTMKAIAISIGVPIENVQRYVETFIQDKTRGFSPVESGNAPRVKVIVDQNQVGLMRQYVSLWDDMIYKLQSLSKDAGNLDNIYDIRNPQKAELTKLGDRLVRALLTTVGRRLQD
jgi:hypothetical protein